MDVKIYPISPYFYFPEQYFIFSSSKQADKSSSEKKHQTNRKKDVPAKNKFGHGSWSHTECSVSCQECKTK